MRRRKKTTLTMNDYQDIIEALRDLMKAKGIGPQRLSSTTDVPRRFIDAILNGEFDKLPARPYIRGYLYKISNALGVESDLLWQIYRSSTESLSSGEKDTLPINRFALRKLNSGLAISILLVVLVIIFLAFNFNRIIGKPTLDVNIPESTNEEVFNVEGLINPSDVLTLNGELIYTDEEGNFEKRVQMEPGLNTLEFKIKRYLGRETTLIKQIFYQPIEE